jgi:hypothetical protein
MLHFLTTIKTKIFGVAPYNAENNDHVIFGDSIKIKEYLGANIPFLVSADTYIEEDLKPFGLVYTTLDDVHRYLENGLLAKFEFNI